MKNNTILKYIKRKSLLYKTGVEYGDYTINHVLGCSHGCLYPCYAMLMAKRFGKVETYKEWIKPKIVENAIDLLQKEIPKYKNKIKFVHFCFSTDPFMYGFKEVEDLSITLISLDENFREKVEPFSAPYKERIECLSRLHKHGIKTWVSIEPYPTPNIIDQEIEDVLNSISFADKIVFGKMNYNSMISKYKDYKKYFNGLSEKIIEFCRKNKKEYHIKEGTIAENS